MPKKPLKKISKWLVASGIAIFIVMIAHVSLGYYTLSSNSGSSAPASLYLWLIIPYLGIISVLFVSAYICNKD